VFDANYTFVYATQRTFGEVRRAIRLPTNANQDQAHAHLWNGVLTINFPKLATEKVGKKIPLTVKEAHSHPSKAVKKGSK
jgi:HSP20 family molecular chaperone IbpA